MNVYSYLLYKSIRSNIFTVLVNSFSIPLKFRLFCVAKRCMLNFPTVITDFFVFTGSFARLVYIFGNDVIKCVQIYTCYIFLVNMSYKSTLFISVKVHCLSLKIHFFCLMFILFDNNIAMFAFL